METQGRSHCMGLVTSVLIFTDGSFKQASNGELRQCAWAFSVWLQGDVGERYSGHSAYSSVPPHTAYWLGEEEESSSTAEQLALAWALVWALDRGVAFHAPIIFAYDNVSAGGGAFGASLPPGTNSALQTSRLSAVTASLRQCLETRTQVLHRHVKSHSGILGNEIVDVLAKNASKLAEGVGPAERCLPSWPALFAAHPLHQWAWLALDRGGDMPTLYALPSEAARLQSSLQPAAAPTGQVQPPLASGGKLEVSLRLVTYNVLTLLCPGVANKGPAGTNEVGMRVFGKRDLLKRQLIEAGVHVAALQETRLAASQLLPDQDFFMWLVWYGHLAAQGSSLPVAQGQTAVHSGASRHGCFSRTTPLDHPDLLSSLQMCSTDGSCPPHLSGRPRLRGRVLLASRQWGRSQHSRR